MLDRDGEVSESSVIVIQKPKFSSFYARQMNQPYKMALSNYDFLLGSESSDTYCHAIEIVSKSS